MKKSTYVTKCQQDRVKVQQHSKHKEENAEAWQTHTNLYSNVTKQGNKTIFQIKHIFMF